jgi:hypothetical protein
MEDILLEMDRILRPEGTVILRDDVDVLLKVQRMAKGMRWKTLMANHEDSREKLLFAVERYWTAEASEDEKGASSEGKDKGSEE